MNIKQLFSQALQQRSIFHSEADFQHHLAWFIHEHASLNSVRLELPFADKITKRLEYCDIVLERDRRVGIELKYKTKALHKTLKGEQFRLKQQGAQGHGRYDFLKDIVRLEQWCREGQIDEGYAILLTNDLSYCKVPTRRTKMTDQAFRLHDRTISGQLDWGKDAAEGSIAGRLNTLKLTSSYQLSWQDAPEEGFKYLFVKVSSSKLPLEA